MSDPFEKSSRMRDSNINTQYPDIPEESESQFGPEIEVEEEPNSPGIAPDMSNITTSRKGKNKSTDADDIAQLIAQNQALQRANEALMQRLDRMDKTQSVGHETHNTHTIRPTIETYGRENSAIAEAVPPIARAVSERPTIRSENVTGRGRSAKISDPEKLSDRRGTPFKRWEMQVLGKLRINHDHYDDEEARMYFVFSCTTGEANDYLYPRYQYSSNDRFASHLDMLSYLNSIYTDADRPVQARKEYHELHMLPKQAFTSFRARFQLLADEANIPTGDRLNDMFLRLTPELRVAMEIPMYGHPQDGSIRAFHQFCDTATSIDTNRRRALFEQKKYASNAPFPTMTPVANNIRPIYRAAVTPAPVGEARGQFTMLTKPNNANAEGIQCYNCKGKGHIAKDCPQPRKVSIKELDYEDEHSTGNEDEQLDEEFIASIGATSLPKN
jgi:hypothetical protein